LNSVSPFKDAYKAGTQNFILGGKEEEEKNIQERQKAKPPIVKKPLTVINKPNEQGMYK